MQVSTSSYRGRGRLLVAVGLLATVVTAAVGGTGNYLIITAEAYYNSAPLNEFVAGKTQLGYNVMVYSVPAGTSRAAIRDYILSLWGGPNAPEYVLIVGDTDGTTSATSTTIPHWVGVGSRQGDTDLYYACMDGPSDWYPDLYIGRFSVRSVSKLADVVEKSLFVELGEFPDPTYAKRAAFLATDDSTAQAEQIHNFVIENYLEPAEFQCTKIYAASGGGTAQISAAVNNGVLFCVYFGHSSSTGWWSPGFTQGNVNALTNFGKYGLVMGWSCNTSHYSYDECFGETWLRKADAGAAVYLSASNYVWWGSPSAWDSSRRMEKYFFQAVFEHDLWRVGPAWQHACYTILADPDYGPTHDHTRNIFEEFVILGDPSLRLPSRALRILLPEGTPEFLEPGEPTSIAVKVLNESEIFDPDTGTLYYRYDGGEFLTVPFVHLGGDLYEATLPPAACAELPQFYFAATGDRGTVVYEPEHAPNDVYAATVAHVTQYFHDDFETGLGWTISNDPSLTGGAWQRGVPVNCGRGDPPADFDGSGKCFLTENNPYTCNSDVDWGPTRLISPAIDLSGASNVILRYARWFTCDDAGTYPSEADFMEVEVSTDDGATWTLIEIVAHTDGWVLAEFNLSDFVTPSAQTRIRFTVDDTPNNSITEAAIDAFSVFRLSCSMFGPGDMNCDGLVNAFDIDPFVLALTDAAAYAAQNPDCDYMNGDMNGDGLVNAFDIDPFVARLTAGQE